MSSINVYIKYAFLSSLCYSYSVPVFAERKYLLKAIDTFLILDYHILHFEGGENPKVLSPTDSKPIEGCWTELRIGRRYPLTLEDASVIHKGVMFPIRPGGYGTHGKQILKPGEHFYRAKEINGLLIKR